MLHFSCDICGHQLDDNRFIVRMEIYPAFDPEEIDATDLDVDHLQDIADMIDDGMGGKLDADECGTKTFRFDLCPRCHRKYVRDPLGREAGKRLNFSEN
jgi:hypothetical protein